MTDWNRDWQVIGFTSGAKDSDFWSYMEIINNRVGRMGAYLFDLLDQDIVAS